MKEYSTSGKQVRLLVAVLCVADSHCAVSQPNTWLGHQGQRDPTMQKQKGCLGKGCFGPGSSVSSTDACQVEGLLILPCPQQVLGLLIKGNWPEQHHLHWPVMQQYYLLVPCQIPQLGTIYVC